MATKLRTIIGECIGEASMLWSESPNGVFESSRALVLANETADKIHQLFGMGETRYAQQQMYIGRLEARLREVMAESIEPSYEHEGRTYSDEEIEAEMAKLKEGK